MRVFTSKYEPIELAEQPFASGGEGAVFNVITAPRHMKDICVKLYHIKNSTTNQDSKKQKEREDRIKYMVMNPPSTIRGENFMLGWPMEWVINQHGSFLGFVMPLGFSGSKELVVLTSTTLSKKLGKEWQDRYDRSLGKKALLSRLKLICNISIPVHILHSTGKYVLKDFKPQNVLVTKEGKVTIVDMDSIQISVGNRLLYPGTAATPDYIPPEYYNHGVGKKEYHLIHQSWDMFAVGVVFYQLLFGLHPYTITPKMQLEEGSNSTSQNISSNLFPFGKNAHLVEVRPKLHDKFNVLPKDIQDLFIRTFTDDFGNRPTAESWGRIIYKHIIVAEQLEPVHSREKNNTVTTDIGKTATAEPNNIVNDLNDKNEGEGYTSKVAEFFGSIGCLGSIVCSIAGLFLGYDEEGLSGALGFAFLGGIVPAALFGFIAAIIDNNHKKSK